MAEMLKCPKCGNQDSFYAHQSGCGSISIKVNRHGEWMENLDNAHECFDWEAPEGPFECTTCESEVELVELNADKILKELGFVERICHKGSWWNKDNTIQVVYKTEGIKFWEISILDSKIRVSAGDELELQQKVSAVCVFLGKTQSEVT